VSARELKLKMDVGKMLGVYTGCLFDVWRKRGVDFLAIKNDTNAMLLGLVGLAPRRRNK